MTTYCEDCAHVTNDSRKGPWYRWTCIKFPRLEGAGFVTKDLRETDPYMRCSDINGGACPLFSERADKQVKLGLEE